MRKTVVTTMLLVLLFSSTKSFSQISTFSFDGIKNYENGNKIAYFYIDGLSDNHQAYYVQNELRKKTSISRFFIYPYKNETNRCMIECSQNINENTIKEYINNSIDKYNNLLSQSNNMREFYLNLYSIDDMPKYVDTGNRKNDVIQFKEKFEKWKNQNPDKYLQIRTISIDTFIQE